MLGEESFESRCLNKSNEYLCAFTYVMLENSLRLSISTLLWNSYSWKTFFPEIFNVFSAFLQSKTIIVKTTCFSYGMNSETSLEEKYYLSVTCWPLTYVVIVFSDFDSVAKRCLFLSSNNLTARFFQAMKDNCQIEILTVFSHDNSLQSILWFCKPQFWFVYSN